ncbi:hypothetical protein GGQ64_002165 [Rhizobium azooxidifex]|uniref:Uncharacterized protein n=1 Tax=Mycoplana azooxidifex TaxID=1636188 RepID=A0A7W6DA13_9HYPH|nr:hypothetical protein [Mycoplana azooxidifex]MBB3976965.1 hypothetical protein [Mycoplana azooxidifex]
MLQKVWHAKRVTEQSILARRIMPNMGYRKQKTAGALGISGFARRAISSGRKIHMEGHAAGPPAGQRQARTKKAAGVAPGGFFE